MPANARRSPVHSQHSQPPRQPSAALQRLHGWVQDQADQRRDDEDQQDLARGAREQKGRDERERQHDKLDPARNNGTRRPRIGGRPPRVTGQRPLLSCRRRCAEASCSPSPNASHSGQSMAEPQAAAPERGQHPVRRGHRWQYRPPHADRLPGGAARAQDFTFVVVNAENAAGALASPRRSPAASSRPASTRSRSATTPTIAGRSTPTSMRSRESCAPPTTCAPSPGTAPASWRAASGVKLGVINLSGNIYVQAGRPAFSGDRDRARRAREADHILVDMHAEATSEKVGLGLASGRQGDRGGRHPHACPHRRWQGAPRRHRLHNRRRHDRSAGRRDRRTQGAGDRVDAHSDAHAL